MSNKTKQIVSAILTFLIYTFIFNWKISILFIIGIGFHEYSHIWAAHRVGLTTKGFYFLPFVGGAAIISGRYEKYSQQAFVALMGPVGGTALAIVTYFIWLVTKVDFFATAASWMVFINLFNLLPLSFMDGGQIMDTISYSINRTLGMVLHIISTVIAIPLLWMLNPILSIVIGLFGTFSCFREVRNWIYYRNNKTYLCEDYYINRPTKMSNMIILSTLVSWIGTVVILLVTEYLIFKSK